MEISLTTPALLFPAISLLLLAYTNRFLAIANLIRGLHSQWEETQDAALFGQIKNLRRRVYLIRNMQVLGIGSLFLCVLCMFLLFEGWLETGKIIFGISLLMLLLSLALTIVETQISVNALNIQLSSIKKEEKSD